MKKCFTKVVSAVLLLALSAILLSGCAGSKDAGVNVTEESGQSEKRLVLLLIRQACQCLWHASRRNYWNYSGFPHFS